MGRLTGLPCADPSSRDGCVGDAEDRAQALSIASRAGQAARMRDGSVDGWLEWLDRYGDDPEAVERVIATLRAENRDAEADALEDAR